MSVIVRPDGLINTEQASELCGVSPITIRQWVHRGFLKVARRERGRILFSILSVAQADQEMRNRSGRQASETPEWEVEGYPDIDMSAILQVCAEEARLAALDRSPVVYYLRFADRIKIGTTCSLRSRLDSTPHDELLATESGDFGLERARHRQFAEYRISGEWFRRVPPIMEHIAFLRASAASSVALDK